MMTIAQQVHLPEQNTASPDRRATLPAWPLGLGGVTLRWPRLRVVRGGAVSSLDFMP
jgi:hypothetical protein